MNEIERVNVESEMKERAERILAASGTVRIEDNRGLEIANQVELGLDQAAKAWNDYWKDLVADAKASYDGLRDRRDALLKPLKEAKEKVRTMISVYLTEQRRLKEEAEKRAFEEEQTRIRKEAEAKDNLDLAEMAEAQGDKGAAEEFLGKAAEAEKEARPSTQVYVPPTPELEGQHMRVLYDFVVENVADLPREYMMANEKAIRAMVDARKAGFTEASLVLGAVIPGVKIIKKVIPVKNRSIS